MSKKTVTEEDFTTFKKDILEVIKMHGNKIEEVLKKDRTSPPLIPDPEPKPDMPLAGGVEYICVCNMVKISKNSKKLSPIEQQNITSEVKAIMTKYKVSKLEAAMLKIYE